MASAVTLRCGSGLTRGTGPRGAGGRVRTPGGTRHQGQLCTGPCGRAHSGGREGAVRGARAGVALVRGTPPPSGVPGVPAGRAPCLHRPQGCRRRRGPGSHTTTVRPRRTAGRTAGHRARPGRGRTPCLLLQPGEPEHAVLRSQPVTGGTPRVAPLQELRVGETDGAQRRLRAGGWGGSVSPDGVRGGRRKGPETAPDIADRRGTRPRRGRPELRRPEPSSRRPRVALMPGPRLFPVLLRTHPTPDRTGSLGLRPRRRRQGAVWPQVTHSLWTIGFQQPQL